MNLWNFRFFIRRDQRFGATELFLRTQIKDGVFFVAESGTIASVRDDPSTQPTEIKPVLTFREEDAGETLQSLMDELWGIGMRPSDIGTAGHLAATTKHLEDMRSIAFAKLEVAKP